MGGEACPQAQVHSAVQKYRSTESCGGGEERGGRVRQGEEREDYKIGIRRRLNVHIFHSANKIGYFGRSFPPSSRPTVYLLNGLVHKA